MATTAKDRLAALTKLYAANRPLIQRSLNIAFALYAVHNTYRSISSRPAQSSSQSVKDSKGKGKEKDEGEATKKPPRVAVRHNARSGSGNGWLIAFR